MHGAPIDALTPLMCMWTKVQDPATNTARSFPHSYQIIRGKERMSPAGQGISGHRQQQLQATFLTSLVPSTTGGPSPSPSPSRLFPHSPTSTVHRLLGPTRSRSNSVSHPCQVHPASQSINQIQRLRTSLDPPLFVSLAALDHICRNKWHQPQHWYQYLSVCARFLALQPRHQANPARPLLRLVDFATLSVAES